MLDFERNYRIRRAISQALQQSQKSESQVAERNKQIVIHCKREMLLLLSKWLLELNSASTISEAERQEIQSLTHISLDKWLQLQAIATQTEKDLKDAEDKEKEARALLNKKTPFGTVTKMVADAESKMQMKFLTGQAPRYLKGGGGLPPLGSGRLDGQCDQTNKGTEQAPRY